MKVQSVKTKAKGGFTLIELLIVIGLLGALTALILPRLSGERDTALLEVCDYNQAGTARNLAQYAQLYGVLPDAMHTELETNAQDTGGNNLMGMPEDAVANFTGSTVQLTADQAASLKAGGITNLAYNVGYELEPVADGLNVCAVTATWEDDAGGLHCLRQGVQRS
jgi:prepilin-type N-terminal cleavage/methylation domain-containing protein